MKEGGITLDMVVIADDQATKVPQPGKGSFDLPAFAVAPQFSSVVRRLASH